jgi:hypothetical protein
VVQLRVLVVVLAFVFAAVDSAEVVLRFCMDEVYLRIA